MKRIAIIAALFAATAVAGPLPVWKDGVTRTYWPSAIAWPDGTETTGANVEQCIAAGVARWETEAEWTEREAAETKAAQAAAEQAALYADPQPAVFVPRVGGTLTNVVGESQVFVDDTGEVFAVDETGSPEHTTKQKDDQHAAAKSARAAAKSAIEDAAKNGKVNARLDAIEAALKTLLK